MQQTPENQTPSKRIYEADHISNSAFFGGPLSAGYMIAYNFSAFDESGKAKTTFLFTIIMTVLYVTAELLIPDHIRYTKFLMRFIYYGSAHYLVKHNQGRDILSHVNSGGKTHRWWMSIVVFCIGATITEILVFFLKSPFFEALLNVLKRGYICLE